MRIVIKFMFLLVLLSGCWVKPLEIVDETSMHSLEERPSENMIIGSWNVDQQTYELINEKKVYRSDTVRLTFKSDMSFTAVNFPDFIIDGDGFGVPKEGKLYQLEGIWELEQVYGKWKIKLSFDKVRANEGSLITWYDLYQKDNSIVILSFVGDPDQGDRLLFKKQKP